MEKFKQLFESVKDPAFLFSSSNAKLNCKLQQMLNGFQHYIFTLGDINKAEELKEQAITLQTDQMIAGIEYLLEDKSKKQ